MGAADRVADRSRNAVRAAGRRDVRRSTQETVEIPAKSDQCVAAGLPPIETVVYDRQDELTAALIAGEIDAMSADSPVTGFAIKGSGGALEPAGEVVRHRAVRLAGAQGLGAGGVAAAGAGASDVDR